MIGSTIKVKGEVSGEENLIVEGTVEGAISLNGHDLTIGQSGRVDANLAAKTVKVEGQVNGDINGAEKVVITKSGHVLGNIVAPRVTLEDGAKFKGSIDMDPGVDAGKSAPPAKPKAASTPTSASSGKAETASEKRTSTAS
ncbi:MAG: polymer-forming cytoskeletal protein [Pseudomonadota bacterium]